MEARAGDDQQRADSRPAGAETRTADRRRFHGDHAGADLEGAGRGGRIRQRDALFDVHSRQLRVLLDGDARGVRQAHEARVRPFLDFRTRCKTQAQRIEPAGGDDAGFDRLRGDPQERRDVPRGRGLRQPPEEGHQVAGRPDGEVRHAGFWPAPNYQRAFKSQFSLQYLYKYRITSRSYTHSFKSRNKSSSELSSPSVYIYVRQGRFFRTAQFCDNIRRAPK